jgi:hypothetical protein
MGTKVKKKKWKCKTRKLPYGQCEYSCEVYAEFEPNGCLLVPVWEMWEEITGE